MFNGMRIYEKSYAKQKILFLETQFPKSETKDSANGIKVLIFGISNAKPALDVPTHRRLKTLSVRVCTPSKDVV